MDNDFDSVSWKDEHDDDGLRAVGGESSSAVHDINGKRRASEGGEDDTNPEDEHADDPGFEDGVLECTVGTPLKENDGTKDAYISYLITTHVRRTVLRLEQNNADHYGAYRRTSSPFSNQTSPSVAASQTSTTYTEPSSNNTRHAQSLRSLTSIKWNMSAVIDSDLISPTAAHGRCIALSRG